MPSLICGPVAHSDGGHGAILGQVRVRGAPPEDFHHMATAANYVVPVCECDDMSSAAVTESTETCPPAAVGSGTCPPMVAVELDAVAGALRRLREIEWWRIGDADVLAAAQRVEAVLRSGYGVQVRLAGEIAAREMTAWTGHRSTAGLLAEMLRIPVGQARGRVDAARLGLGSMALSGESIAAAVPALMDAIDEGALSDEHLAVITRCLGGIPAAVDSETVTMCRELLLSEARQRDPLALRGVAERIRLICDDTGAEPGPDPVDRAELHLGAVRPDGLTPVRGLLDPLTAEQLRVAVEALAAPKPIDDRTADPRPAGVRRAQALSEVLTRYFAAGCSGNAGPGARSVRPVVAITIPASASPECSCGGGSTAGAILRHRAATGVLVGAVGAVPTRPASGGWFDYGGPVPARTANLLACDGTLIRQVVRHDGAVLDQGRARRLFTQTQRRALITRDRGCAFPGCDIPAGWCEAHHITPWSEGGATDLANGVLLCRRHHVVIHQGRWRIDAADADRGRPWFVPPAHIDLARTPRRNHHIHPPVIRGGVMRR